MTWASPDTGVADQRSTAAWSRTRHTRTASSHYAQPGHDAHYRAGLLPHSTLLQPLATRRDAVTGELCAAARPARHGWRSPSSGQDLRYCQGGLDMFQAGYELDSNRRYTDAIRARASQCMGTVTERNAWQLPVTQPGTPTLYPLATLTARGLADANVIFSAPPGAPLHAMFRKPQLCQNDPTPPAPAAPTAARSPVAGGVRPGQPPAAPPPAVPSRPSPAQPSRRAHPRAQPSRRCHRPAAPSRPHPQPDQPPVAPRPTAGPGADHRQTPTYHARCAVTRPICPGSGVPTA